MSEFRGGQASEHTCWVTSGMEHTQGGSGAGPGSPTRKTLCLQV